MPGELLLRLTVGGDEERAILRGALLSARAAELAEVRRRSGRLSYGYGTDSARETMGAEADRARRRVELLDRLIAALDGARADDRSGGDEASGRS